MKTVKIVFGVAVYALLSGLSADRAAAQQIEPFPGGYLYKNFVPEIPVAAEHFTEAKPFDGFRIRGIKGWNWTARQTLEEIPFLKSTGMNFFMNCYTSTFDFPNENKWWEPFSDQFVRDYENIVTQCRKNGIEFCFAMNPNIAAHTAFDYDNEEHFDVIWRKYEWMAGLGVNWFSVCLDDISKGLDAEGQARFVNRLYGKLIEINPDASMVFCPSIYAGTYTVGGVDNETYLAALAENLHSDIYCFWTGDFVCGEITSTKMKQTRDILRHRIIIWDNYPVNDATQSMNLGPVVLRDNDLHLLCDGYMGNPMCSQNRIGRLPIYTAADYAWSPGAYDSWSSAGQAILNQSETPQQAAVLQELVALYPGFMWADVETGWHIHNSARRMFEETISKENGKQQGGLFIARAGKILTGMQKYFPEKYTAEENTLAVDIAWMKEVLENKTTEVVLRLPPGEDNPRNSEGDFITLKDGRILFIYSHYTGDSSRDDDPAYLAGRYSDDGGRTWSGEDFTVLENEGGMNVMSVSLLRLRNGNIAFFYLRKNSVTDCIPMMRISTDEARTWSDPVACITDKKGYFVLNNDRVIQLANGRLVMAVARHMDPAENKWHNKGELFCYYSDDDGQTWMSSLQVPDTTDIAAQEPGLIELKDSSIMMYVRADDGFQHLSYSRDNAQTWSHIEKSGIASPLSPATIARVPSTGDLLLVWNNNDGSREEIKGERTPLTAAVSKDEGKTWEHVADIETDPDGWYCYTAIHFVKDYVLLGYIVRENNPTIRVSASPT